MISNNLICKEMLHDSRTTEMHEDELKALTIYLIFIDIFLTGTNHGCQFSINVVAAHMLNISKMALKFDRLNIYPSFFLSLQNIKVCIITYSMLTW